MNERKVCELVEKLTHMSESFTIGWKNEEAIAEMDLLIRQLELECSCNGYLGEKLGSARHNFDMMFSPRASPLRRRETIANRFRSDLLSSSSGSTDQVASH